MWTFFLEKSCCTSIWPPAFSPFCIQSAFNGLLQLLVRVHIMFLLVSYKLEKERKGQREPVICQFAKRPHLMPTFSQFLPEAVEERKYMAPVGYSIISTTERALRTGASSFILGGWFYFSSNSTRSYGSMYVILDLFSICNYQL